MSAAHRHPPTFQIDVGLQPRQRGLIPLLAALATASFVAALSLHQATLGWLFLAVPSVAALAWHLARIERRHLQWDGQLWHLSPENSLDPGLPVDIQVLFDFGDWLPLRSQEQGAEKLLPPRRHYLPLTRRSLGAGWGQLRATVYSARPVVASTA